MRGFLVATLILSACTNTLEVDVELIAPVDPDPFTGVTIVRLYALVAGELLALGEDRWDQGPIDLPLAIDPVVERFVVEGLSSNGTLISSGASEALDLYGSPPEGRIPIVFTRVGALSLLSASGEARNGARAIELDGGRVLFVGGTDASGSPLEKTEIATQIAIRAGPPLSGGRTGNFRALPFAGSRVVIAGGDDPRIAALDADANTTRFSAELPPIRAGAAIAAVSESLLIIAGGEDASGISDEMLRFDLERLEMTTPGKLVDARAESTAVAVSGGRVLMLGGRSGARDDTAKRDAPVFDPSRGTAALRAIDLGTPLIAPTARVTAAGTTIIAGGRGSSSARVAAVVVQPERAQAFGDTSTVTAVAEAINGGELLDLDDGSLLFLPAEAGQKLQHISLLPVSIVLIDPLAADPGPWIGGRIGDGTVLLRSAAGRFARFNPGTRAVLGAFHPDLPIIPLRPNAWERIDGGVEGRLLPGLPSGGLVPAELAVLGATELDDFELTFTLELAPLSQAAIAFGLRAGDFDHVSLLGNLALVGRAQAVGTPPAIPCTSIETEPLAGTGPHRIRVARKKSEVRADLNADGADDLVCTTPGSAIGRVALGVITGRARYTAISIRTSF